MLELFFALWGSKPVRWALSAVLALGAYQGWKYHQRSIGAAEVTAKIERKAETNVKNADAVRHAVGSGTRGMRHPYTRP